MRTLQMPENKCPYCDHKFDACTTLESLDSPRQGDVTICVKCGGFLRFRRGLILEKLHPLELRQLALQRPEYYRKLVEMSDLIQMSCLIRQLRGGDRP